MQATAGREATATPSVSEIIARHSSRPGALLPVLHEIQDCLGYIPREAVAVVADGLNLSRAEVHGVISFYHDFRHEPAPRLRICMGEACQAMGAAALLEQLRGAGGDHGHDDVVYCLGNCACAPNVELQGEPRGRVDAQVLEGLLGEEVQA